MLAKFVKWLVGLAPFLSDLLLSVFDKLVKELSLTVRSVGTEFFLSVERSFCLERT